MQPPSPTETGAAATLAPATLAPETLAIGVELDRLLQDQLHTVRRRFFVHGLGLVLLLPAAAVLLAFLLDHSLRLPQPIRLLHSAAIASLTVFAALRYVRYPLRKVFAPVDVALWVERGFPELHQALVSAIQLKATLTGDLRNQSAAMVERLLAEVAVQARQLPMAQLLDRRITARIWAGAATLLLVLAAGAAFAPATASAFLARHLGGNASYPRATSLQLELPPNGPELQRSDRGREIELVLPAGADLHVSVLAVGVVPKEVFLDTAGGGSPARAVGMTPRGGDRFRHVFRRIHGGFEFHARGGDDDDGDHSVTVRVVHPPMVETITARLTPPAYTGQEPSERLGGAIEALTGTQVQLTVKATASVGSAAMVCLESGKRLELKPQRVEDDAGKTSTWTTTFAVEQSDRYQIDLVGDSGLRNPNPGTYPIAALQDYAPVGHWLLPEDESATMLLPEGILCVRLDAKDDFGLTAVALSIEAAGKPHDFALLPPVAAGAAWPKAMLPIGLYPVKDLLGGQKAGLDGLALTGELQDNRLPQASVTKLPRRSVQVVDPTQLAAAIARVFRGLREDIERAHDLQTDRKARVDDLLAQPGGDVGQILTGVEVGQGRVLAAGEAGRRELMRAFDLHLWNRLEPAKAADDVIELYRNFHRDHGSSEAFVPDFYRDLLARRKAGTLGAMETTLDPILQMVGLADNIVAELSPLALRLLTTAQVAKDDGQRLQALRALAAVQEQMQATLKQLLLRLDEWNDFQDVIQETRALRDRQKDVQSRTEEMRGKKQ